MKKIIVMMLILTLLCTSCLLTSCAISSQGGASEQKVADGIDRPLEPNYTVKFVTNGGSAISQKTLNVLETIPETTREGYLFDGWYRESTLKTAVVLPLTLEGDTTLYAKWLQLKDTMKCEGATLKCWEGSDHTATYKITPNRFDMDRLVERGYTRITVEVTYLVEYRKDYDVPFDIGYAGAPKYTVGIVDSENTGHVLEGLSTTTSEKERSITYTVSIADLQKDQIYLKFMTENIQNKVIFSDINITFECIK